MWIVQIALRRPYTFVVLAILILVMGGAAIFRTPTDIFPNIDIPVVSIIWSYNGLVPKEMTDRIVSVTERNLTTVVDNIEHVESQTLYGIAVVKVFLQPNASLDRAIAQITASSQTQLRLLPAGTTPPLVITYSASSVPGHIAPPSTGDHFMSISVMAIFQQLLALCEVFHTKL